MGYTNRRKYKRFSRKQVDELKNEYVLIRLSLETGFNSQLVLKTEANLTDYRFFQMYNGIEEWVHKNDIDTWRYVINIKKTT